MLLGYGARNFLSFKEGINLSFKLNSKVPKEISKNKNVTNVMCVKGANASGKSNVLEILDFLSNFCCNSFASKPDTKINCKPFFESEDPTDFYMEFLDSGYLYRYELTLTENGIISESLNRKKYNPVIENKIENDNEESKKKNRFTPIFLRKKNEIVKKNAQYKELSTIKLRSNVSVISTANQYQLNCIESIYMLFFKIITNLENSFWFNFNSLPDVSFVLSRSYYDNPHILKFVKSIICQMDIGIDDIKIKKEEDNITGKPIYIPYFQHTNNKKKYTLRYSDESTGTKALYNQLYFYSVALTHSGVLVLDEFDNNLHPHILPLLVDLFMDPKKNKKNAQLVFTTHNTEIIDKLGKYRTFIVNKEDNESYGYRLDELSGDTIMRPDRPISPVYSSGEVGGVPKIEKSLNIDSDLLDNISLSKINKV